MTWKRCKVWSRDLSENTVTTFACEDCGKPRKISASIIHTPVEIRTCHLWNSNHKRFFLSQLAMCPGGRFPCMQFMENWVTQGRLESGDDGHFWRSCWEWNPNFRSVDNGSLWMTRCNSQVGTFSSVTVVANRSARWSVIGNLVTQQESLLCPIWAAP
jgi:hypothetical protein